MTLTPSLPNSDPSGLSAAARRRIQAGMVARAADGTPRTGVIPEHFNALVTGKASMGYDIQPFVAVTSRQSPGVEFVANDGIVDLSPAGYAAPLANSRLDVIWVRSRFTIFGDSVNTPEFGLTQGTAATSPILPVIPAGALAIGVAEVKSTDTTTATVVIQPPSQYTGLADDMIPVRTQAELDAWQPRNGARARRLDTGAEYLRAGGSWTRVGIGLSATAGAAATGGFIVAPGSNAAIANLVIAGGVRAGGVIRFQLGAYLFFPTGGTYAGGLEFVVNGTRVLKGSWANRKSLSGVITPSASMDYRVPADITSDVTALIRISSDAPSVGGIEVWDANYSISYDYVGG